jgi:hypothetical protein
VEKPVGLFFIVMSLGWLDETGSVFRTDGFEWQIGIEPPGGAFDGGDLHYFGRYLSPGKR